MTALIDKLKGSQASLQKLTLVAEAAHLLNSTLDYEKLLKNILTLLTRAVSAEAAMVYRYDPQRQILRGRFYSGDEEPERMTFRKGEGFVGWVAEHNEPVLTNDPTNDERYIPHLSDELGEIKLDSILVYPLTLRGEFFGVIEAINKKDGGFDQSDMETFDILSDQIAVAIQNAQLYRTLKEEALQRNTLFEVSRQLMAPLTLDEVMYHILLALQKVVDFHAGAVYLIDDETEDIGSISSVGYGDDADLSLKVGQGIVGTVAKTAKPELVGDVAADPRYVNARPQTRSEIVVPIISGIRLIGAFNLEHDDLNAFSQSDLEVLTAFASQAAISIERARMTRYMLEQKKIEEQLSIARTIQKTFLPDKVPEPPGYDLWGTNIASGEVGGDYFDFIRIVENQIGIAIADVSGKGIPAALIMASFRASLIAEIRNNYAIRTICGKVNNLLCESLEPGNFVTAIYGVLDTKNSIFTFSDCGHNPALLLRADDSVEELFEGGMLLGVRPQATYEERPVYIRNGDILCMFTDGITEAEDENGEQFENERLLDTIRRHRTIAAEEIGAKVIDAVHAFADRRHVMDDLTLIIVKRR